MMDQELIDYFAIIPMGEARRHPDGSLFGYATGAQLHQMFADIGVPNDFEEYNRPSLCASAVDYLSNTPPRVEDGFPYGIEKLIQALCDRAKNFDNLENAIQRLNTMIVQSFVYISHDDSDELQFHYGGIYDKNNQLCMEATGQIHELERSLRALITKKLEAKYGNSWEKSCGVSDNRLSNWEKKRGDKTEIGLIYYSDFYDLRTIIDKNWEKFFASSFGDKKKTDVFLLQLESSRNTLAHTRTMTKEEAMLCIGICSNLLGVIRQSLRGRSDTPIANKSKDVNTSELQQKPKQINGQLDLL
jgi:hypothetical protein